MAAEVVGVEHRHQVEWWQVWMARWRMGNVGAVVVAVLVVALTEVVDAVAEVARTMHCRQEVRG